MPLFLGSYPITPASDILHELSKYKTSNVKTFQAEDEIAAIGMVVGAVASYFLGSVLHLGWKGQLAFYLVPTVAYAVMFWGQTFPKSEAALKGANFGEMFKDVGLLGAAVACYLVALFFGGATTGGVGLGRVSGHSCSA